MKWNSKDIDYLIKNYESNPNINEISEKLKKSIRSVQHKGKRLGLSRPRFKKEYSEAQPKKVIDERYYKRNKKKVYERKIRRRRELKEEMVETLGGKCKICGYNKCLSALEFHHHQNNKEGNMGTLLKNDSRQKLLKEAKKCILLCANCHRELHYKGP